MATKEKPVCFGDVVKSMSAHALCTEQRHITMVAAATLPLVVGEMMEPDTAVAQIETYTCAGTADGGTFALGFEGAWSAPIAFNANAAAIKAAFELLPTVIATGLTVTASAALVTGTTITWSAAAHLSGIDIDARLLTDGGVSMEGDSAIAITTPGTLVADMVICATGGNVTGVLLEDVDLLELQTNPLIERAFLVASDGVAIVDGDNLYAVAAQSAAAIAAIDALAGINVRYEPNIFSSGTDEDSLP